MSGHLRGTRGCRTSPRAVRRRALPKSESAGSARFAQAGRLPVAIPLQRLTALPFQDHSCVDLRPRRPRRTHAAPATSQSVKTPILPTNGSAKSVGRPVGTIRSCRVGIHPEDVRADPRRGQVQANGNMYEPPEPFEIQPAHVACPPVRHLVDKLAPQCGLCRLLMIVCRRVPLACL